MLCRRDEDRVFLFQVSENFGLREGKVVRCERESENYQMIKIINEIEGERGRCERHEIFRRRKNHNLGIRRSCQI